MHIATATNREVRDIAIAAYNNVPMEATTKEINDYYVALTHEFAKLTLTDRAGEDIITVVDHFVDMTEDATDEVAS